MDGHRLQPRPTNEKVTVKEQKGGLLARLDDEGSRNPDDASQSLGTWRSRRRPPALINTDWQSHAAADRVPDPVRATANCGNSVASVLYQLIWGTRAPVLSSRSLKGSSWSSTGGANSDVTSSSTYVGHEKVKVPGVPDAGARRAKVRTDITQAGAIGDPYGSGVRTVWWVYGVGPVKIEFQHAGGTDAPRHDGGARRARTRSAERDAPDVELLPARQGNDGTAIAGRTRST